jgi:hypothetical protein
VRLTSLQFWLGQLVASYYFVKSQLEIVSFADRSLHSSAVSEAFKACARCLDQICFQRLAKKLVFLWVAVSAAAAAAMAKGIHGSCEQCKHKKSSLSAHQRATCGRHS